MGLDLWFREDVARILASTHATMVDTLPVIDQVEPGIADVYRRGFENALRSVAIAFGIAMPKTREAEHEIVRR